MLILQLKKMRLEHITRIVYFVCAAMAARNISIFSVSFRNKQKINAGLLNTFSYSSQFFPWCWSRKKWPDSARFFQKQHLFLCIRSLHSLIPLCYGFHQSLPWRTPGPLVWLSGCCPLGLPENVVLRRSHRWKLVVRGIYCNTGG